MMTQSVQKLRSVTVQCLKNQAWVAQRCFVAESFFSRFKGLIGTQIIPQGEGLLITRCNDIHMWFMSIPIDVVFIQKQNDQIYRVTSVYSEVPPWKALPLRDGNAHETLELPAHTISRCQIERGDLLCIA